MAFIAKTTIQEVQTRLDAITVVGDYIRLEKKGSRWWGRCPFHAGGQENTPSFKVDPDLKTYHCFGCHKGGSIIGFVMEMDKLTYPEAIKSMAGKMGIEIVYEEGIEAAAEDTAIKEELFELYRRTTVTFQHFLHEKEQGQIALKYLEDRGISAEMIDSFKLGFAPFDRDFLYKFLKQKGYSPHFLEKSGLFSSKYKTIPLFSGRLIFPITDRQGRIVAFGGRSLPGTLQKDGSEPPKYINSPETEIYKKGQTLYAIELAKPEMRKSKTAYLAEGYMDVLALHQAEIKNTVAPLGTSFTDEQASWLSRWAEKVVLVFDNDEAGQKAANKAIITCRKNGISCSLVQLSDFLKQETKEYDSELKNKDPADILQKFGSRILKKISNYTINDFEYLISRVRSKTGSERSISRAAEYVFPFLNVLDSEVERDDCIARIAESLRIEREAVKKDFVRWKKEGYSPLEAERKQAENRTELIVRRSTELVLLTIVAVNMELYSEFRAALEIKDIEDNAAKELFIAMEECFQHGESGIDSLLSRIKDEALKKFIISNGDSPEFRGSKNTVSVADPRRLMEDGIKEIRKKRLRKRRTEIGAEIRMLERKADISSDSESSIIEDLLAEKKLIDSQILKLEGR